MQTKQRMLKELEGLIATMLTLRSQGTDYAKLSHAQGLVDGFMMALLDSGIATRQELLGLVQSQRRSMDGPAARSVHLDEIETAAA